MDERSDLDFEVCIQFCVFDSESRLIFFIVFDFLNGFENSSLALHSRQLLFASHVVSKPFKKFQNSESQIPSLFDFFYEMKRKVRSLHEASRCPLQTVFVFLKVFVNSANMHSHLY